MQCPLPPPNPPAQVRAGREQHAKHSKVRALPSSPRVQGATQESEPHAHPRALSPTRLTAGGPRSHSHASQVRARFQCVATISSGQNHVVKRLFQRVGGVSVRWLHRDAVGALSLQSLGLDGRPGAWARVPDAAAGALWRASGGAARLLRMKREELAGRLAARPEDVRTILRALRGRGAAAMAAMGGAAAAEKREACEWMGSLERLLPPAVPAVPAVPATTGAEEGAAAGGGVGDSQPDGGGDVGGKRKKK
jgi:hypothetical protein